MSGFESNDMAAAVEVVKRREQYLARQRKEKAAAERAAAERRAQRDEEHLPVVREKLAELKDAAQARKDGAPAYNAAAKEYNALVAAVTAKYQELDAYVGEHFGRSEFGPDGRVVSETYRDLLGGLNVDGERVLMDGTTSPSGHPECRL